MKIRVGGVPEHFNLPWRLLEEDKELLNSMNVELEWEDIHGGTGEMVEKLEKDELDVCVLLTEGITKAIHSGLQAKIVHNYVSSSLKWGIHVPFGSHHQEVSDIDPKRDTFAISRYGSGSHLMVYVLANRMEWNHEDLQFKVVHSLDGGLEALKANDAQVFLWEKFTTYPYTVEEECRFIGEVPTPWPCFSIAAREEFLKEHAELLEQLLQEVMKKAKQVKNNSQFIAVLAERYQLKQNQVEKWLSETEWNISLDDHTSTYKEVKEQLKELNVIS